MLRWQQAENRRHALDVALPPRPGESFVALCGADVTVARADMPELGGNWFAGTCWACDSVWRERENIPPFTGRSRPAS